MGAVGGIAWINISTIARATRLVNAATILKLLPLVIFVVAGAHAIHGGNFSSSATAPSAPRVGHALLLGLFAFTGMEVALCASGEVAQPGRTIPRALAMALVFITLLYVAIQLVAQGIMGASLAQSKAPLADAMSRVSPALRLLMLAGAGVSMFGWLISDVLGTPRLLFALARDRRLPSIMGRLHQRHHVPHVAILCYAMLAIGLAVTASFAQLAVLATLASAGLYIACCAAAWTLARRGVAQAGEPLNFRWLGAAMVIGITSMLALIGLASRAEATGLLVLIGLSVAVFLVQNRTSSGQTTKRGL